MRSVPALLWPTVAAARDRRALALDDRATTYGEFGDLVERSACSSSARSGSARRSRVATVLPNGIEQIAVLFATTTIGAVVVPLNAGQAQRSFSTLSPRSSGRRGDLGGHRR